MQKLFVALFVSLFSIGAFAACDESGNKEKEKQEVDQKFEVSVHERFGR